MTWLLHSQTGSLVSGFRHLAIVASSMYNLVRRQFCQMISSVRPQISYQKLILEEALLLEEEGEEGEG